MREIKFRAWEIKGKGWIAGFNMVNFHHYFNKGLKQSLFRYSTEWEEGEYLLEQFTGLLDKNGKDIYEGDIIDQTQFPEDTPSPCPIVFENGAFRVTYNGWDETLPKPILDISYLSIMDYAVIGNIHQNPELLVKS